MAKTSVQNIIFMPIWSAQWPARLKRKAAAKEDRAAITDRRGFRTRAGKARLKNSFPVFQVD